MGYKLQCLLEECEDELIYRQRYFPNIKSVDPSEIVCSGCGKQIDVKPEICFENSIIGTLLCKPCKSQFSKALSAKEKYKQCKICGNVRNKLYYCKEKCEFFACHSCVSRVCSKVIERLPEKDYNFCFMCNPRRVYKPRALCAVVMEELKKNESDSDHKSVKSLSKKGSTSDNKKKSKKKDIEKISKGLKPTKKMIPLDSSSSDDIQFEDEKEKSKMLRKSLFVSLSSTSLDSISVDNQSGIKKSLKKSVTNKENSVEKKKSLLEKKKTRKNSISSVNSEISVNTSKTSKKVPKVVKIDSDNEEEKNIRPQTRNNNVRIIESTVLKDCKVKLQRLPLESREVLNTSKKRKAESNENTVAKKSKNDNKKKEEVPTNNNNEPSYEDDNLSKPDILSLKKSINHFADDIKRANEKLLNELDSIRKLPFFTNDFTKLDAQELLNKLKNSLEQFEESKNEKKIKFVKEHKNWCKKSMVKNIFVEDVKTEQNNVNIVLDNHDNTDKVKSKKVDDGLTERTFNTANDSDVSEQSVSKKMEVSDCDEEALLTDDETMTQLRAKALTKKDSSLEKNPLKINIENKSNDAGDKSENNSLPSNRTNFSNSDHDMFSDDSNISTSSSLNRKKNKKNQKLNKSAGKIDKEDNEDDEQKETDNEKTDNISKSPQRLSHHTSSSSDLSENDKLNKRKKLNKKTTNKIDSEDEKEDSSNEKVLTPTKSSKKLSNLSLSKKTHAIDVSNVSTNVDSDDTDCEKVTKNKKLTKTKSKVISIDTDEEEEEKNNKKREKEEESSSKANRSPSKLSKETSNLSKSSATNMSSSDMFHSDSEQNKKKKKLSKTRKQTKKDESEEIEKGEITDKSIKNQRPDSEPEKDLSVRQCISDDSEPENTVRRKNSSKPENEYSNFSKPTAKSSETKIEDPNKLLENSYDSDDTIIIRTKKLKSYPVENVETPEVKEETEDVENINTSLHNDSSNDTTNSSDKTLIDVETPRTIDSSSSDEDVLANKKDQNKSYHIISDTGDDDSELERLREAEKSKNSKLETLIDSSLNDVDDIDIKTSSSSKQNNSSHKSKAVADESSDIEDNLSNLSFQLKSKKKSNTDKSEANNSNGRNSKNDSSDHEDVLTCKQSSKDNIVTIDSKNDKSDKSDELKEKNNSKTDKKSKVKRSHKNDSESNKSIDSDEELKRRNEQNRQKLLESSSDSDDDSDRSLDSNNLNKRNSKNSAKSIRVKYNIRENKFYKRDSKLRTKCTVVVCRLSSKILSKHREALKKSRQYVENKKIESLLSTDGPKKKKHQVASDSSDVESTDKKKKNSKNNDSKSTDDLEDVNDDINGTSQLESTHLNESDDLNKSQNDDTQGIFEELEKAAQDKILLSSHSESDANDDDDDDDDIDNKKSEKGKTKKKKEKKNSEDSSEDEDAKKKKSWKRDKLLTEKIISSSDEETTKKKSASTSENNSSEESDSKPTKRKLRKKPRRRLASESDASHDENSDEDSDDESSKKQKKRRKSSSSYDSDSSNLRSKPKAKRRRIREVKSSDSDGSVEEIGTQNSANRSFSGRKNIRKVIKDKQVADDTKQAGKQEEERLRRIAERQKLYNAIYNQREQNEEKVDELVLDFNESTKEKLLVVEKCLVDRLKPHQARGIKFMWNACYESLERANSTEGSGCILAHCMGLGKTFQVVTLCYTLLSNGEKTNVNRILIVAPLTTVLNWTNEFKLWLEKVECEIDVYEMTKAKTNLDRKYQLEHWFKTGGVMVMGYEMFRNLCNAKNKKKSIKESIEKCLINPGPDLVVCDEGHLLKNEDTALSKAMNRVRTLRRIVLTGTPLQNNLREYHCMVQFVKPNLLGSKKEFANRFINPIQNGQFDDSTEQDVKVMKKRAHVLHKMLEGSVQRYDYSVLTPFLPPKQEYVILLKLSDIQCKMYEYYLNNLARRHSKAGSSLFSDFQALQRVWTHPYAMKLHAGMMEKKKLIDDDSEGSLKDFIDDGSEDEATSDSHNEPTEVDSDCIALDDSSNDSKSKKGKKKNDKNDDNNEIKVEEPEKEPEKEPGEDPLWWEQFVKPEDMEDMNVSTKLITLFQIIKESESIGDKVLVFSQSLYSLNLIEKFLGLIHQNTVRGGKEQKNLGNHTGRWLVGQDYFRIDGQTSSINRSSFVNNFNKVSNTRARLFLISTRAGGLGINLTAANRVVIFDASWNPSHDVQSIFRIYRFGQKKPCYVYRLLAAGTMEERIYNRQVTKLSLSCRVVDEQQIERHFSNNDLNELYMFDPTTYNKERTLALPQDRLLKDLFSEFNSLVFNFHEHDSLLENIVGEELDEDERKQAWLEYEQEKAGRPAVYPNLGLPVGLAANAATDVSQQYFNILNQVPGLNNASQFEYNFILELIKKDNPHMTEIQQRNLANKTILNMYSYVENMSRNNVLDPAANQLAQQVYARPHVVPASNVSNTAINPYFAALNHQQRLIPQNHSRSPMELPPTLYPLGVNNVRNNRPVPVDQRVANSHEVDIIEIPAGTRPGSTNAQPSTSSSSSKKGQEE